MNKLNGIKKGDAVEVTFRGRVDGLGPRTLDVIMDGADDPNILWANAIAAPSFSIRKVEPSIAVGDRVRFAVTDIVSLASVDCVGAVVAIDRSLAWVRHDNGAYSSLLLTSLERIP
jgi:hypothetical protein